MQSDSSSTNLLTLIKSFGLFARLSVTVNLLTYYYSKNYLDTANYEEFYRYGFNYQAIVYEHEFYRVLTAAFFHGGMVHLVSNMVILAILCI